MKQNEWSAKRREYLDRHAEQARERTRRMKHKIYRYTFPDGMVYVGITKRTLGHRENTHRRQCSVVGRRLDLGQEPNREILAEYDTRDDALERERLEIAAIPKRRRLNLLSPLDDWKRETANRTTYRETT